MKYDNGKPTHHKGTEDTENGHKERHLLLLKFGEKGWRE
jgi:hypothetical protein